MSKSDSDFTPDEELPRYTPDKLRTIRKEELGVTQEKLAEMTGCDTKTVQRYESGDSSLPPNFIRKLEQFRVEKLEERARAIAKDRIDLSKLLIPGLQLVELRPIRKVAETLHRMFVAVPKESPPPEGEQTPSSPAPEQESSGAGTVPLLLAQGRLPLPEGTVLVENVLSVEVETSETPTRSFSAVQGVPSPGHNTGQQMAAPQIGQLARASKSGTRLMVGIAMVGLVTGCLLSHRAPDEPTAREPVRLTGKLDTSNATNGNETMGARPKQSIKMPKERYSWQKAAPCDSGESEKVGGCWDELSKRNPPCPEYAVEDEEHKCLIPIPANPKKPNTVEPKK